MAIMIPERPREFDEKSQEGIMFDALAGLPDDYYVFHSFRITAVKDGTFRESETDFIIYNRCKGIICLEAKAGAVRYENGRWLYESGLEMKHDGPFNQAKLNKWNLIDHIKFSRFNRIIDHCKFFHAVWFPSLKKEQISHMVFPSEGDKALVLTMESLYNPQEDIDRIYDLNVSYGVRTDISEAESKSFIRNVLCPEFNIFPSASFDTDLKKLVFHRLLDEQAKILNYLDEQKTAVMSCN